MDTLSPNDQNNLTESEKKHWPQIKAIKPRLGEKFAISVNFITPHPMTVEHQIVFIEAFYGSRPLGKKFLKPGDEPKAEFIVFSDQKEEVRVLAFCNLDGLWENKVEIFSNDQ